ncbi:U3 small nucleolar ribonucleoprotein protein IMP3, putative [Trypanosoma brucei gambiense DAL972]|uniref:U3 small nucleolar ribonucleoprotein protein IMP3, putative n=2 Tax=Trypanosoma brucei TaxID=5691 RepID=Q382E4_TRYB2|nr:U3 small nucleolar ribonucleoprotein protein IMP3, putative [Trypanosoma brucei gambiense DAL972]XP_829449.1 U3 small nucleolar ribonucleoprotein IMP3 [Trypanosoma brucei brucei TREU927]EAN80337.1 U3 small nucleolar ribonucleoprotein protein IMP3, putative [Trypanosoma brucei brucei TREU927]CBH18437.1 U3 small nucleolar ribonucleoprotein protein IMP3, putative [Trypanosoma brucei gambiense DAL972]|eukprot:XP_011780701.1 U3 small nucleolar ribonucleoprotein protein IMP3, putative [Trypanosoma brucei gambiense DAL972]
MVRDTSRHVSVVKSRPTKEAVKEQETALKRSKRSKFTPKSSHSKGNPIHRTLKYHEKKLLRKHDFMQYPQDNWHEPFCITKYHLEDREDYRRYLRLVGLIRQLLTHLRYLPADSKIRIQITQQILDKLYAMGLINEKLGLAEVDKVGVEVFCKRRLPTVLRDLNMAPNCKIAADFVHHGHVRVGTSQIRDPAFLVPRDLEDYVTWMPGSKVKQHVDTFNVQRDDYE